MSRPAPPDSSLPHMIDALFWTQTMFKVAAKMEHEISDELKAFFQAKIEFLLPHINALTTAEQDILNFERSKMLSARVMVKLGDVILDRTLRWSNRMAKAELSGKPGLGASHAFGNRIDDLTRESIDAEPEAVRQAVNRLDEVTDFTTKDTIKTKLLDAAERQEEALDSRVVVQRELNALKSEHLSAIHAASGALAQIEAELLEQFPRQYAYVGTFFISTRSKRKRT